MMYRWAARWVGVERLWSRSQRWWRSGVNVILYWWTVHWWRNMNFWSRSNRFWWSFEDL